MITVIFHCILLCGAIIIYTKVVWLQKKCGPVQNGHTVGKSCEVQESNQKFAVMVV